MTVSKPCEIAGLSSRGSLRFLVLDGVLETLQLGFGKRQLSRCQLVQHCSHGPQVRPLIEDAVELFGRHVRQRAGQRHHQGDGLSRGDVDRGIDQLGQAKIQDLQLAVLGDAQVSRLEVAMDDAFTMRRFQSTGELSAQREDGCFWQRPVGQLFVEPGTGDVLRYQEVNAILLAEIKRGGDVGVAQLADGLGFLAEALAGSIIGERLDRKDLERDIAVKSLVVSAKDVALAAAADLLDDAVMTQAVARR